MAVGPEGVMEIEIRLDVALAAAGRVFFPGNPEVKVAQVRVALADALQHMHDLTDFWREYALGCMERQMQHARRTSGLPDEDIHRRHGGGRGGVTGTMRAVQKGDASLRTYLTFLLTCGQIPVPIQMVPLALMRAAMLKALE